MVLNAQTVKGEYRCLKLVFEAREGNPFQEALQHIVLEDQLRGYLFPFAYFYITAFGCIAFFTEVSPGTI